MRRDRFLTATLTVFLILVTGAAVGVVVGIADDAFEQVVVTPALALIVASSFALGKGQRREDRE